MPSPTFVAGGTIQPSTFVLINGSNQVIAASGNSAFLQGVAQEWSKSAPIPGATSEAADNGDPVAIYGLGEVCLLQATTAGWTAGDRLTSNASGQGVTASGSQYYGAVALATLSGAGLGRVQVVFGKNP